VAFLRGHHDLRAWRNETGQVPARCPAAWHEKLGKASRCGFCGLGVSGKAPTPRLSLPPHALTASRASSSHSSSDSSLTSSSASPTAKKAAAPCAAPDSGGDNAEPRHQRPPARVLHRQRPPDHALHRRESPRHHLVREVARESERKKNKMSGLRTAYTQENPWGTIS